MIFAFWNPDPSWFRYVALVSVAVYFIFDHWDRKTVLDEREELIRLKTSELIQKLTLWTVTALAAGLAVEPELPAVYPVMAVVLVCLYGEIFGKLYYRRKI